MATLDDAFLFEKREKAMIAYANLCNHFGRISASDQRRLHAISTKVFKKEKLSRVDIDLIFELSHTYSRFLN